MNRTDVTPPGREAQVKALKEKPEIDNPWAVAWASYNRDDGPTWMGAKCDDCGTVVPVRNATYDAHVSSSVTHGDDGDGDDDMEMCDGSGKQIRNDVVEQRGGKWVLIAKSTGKVLGEHATREEAEVQERAVQASKHSDGGRVRRWEHFDFSGRDLPSARKTADGFWQVYGKVARTGIQEYHDSSGGIRRELRLPEDVIASLPTFALQPLTNEHPPEMIDPDNAKKYVAGAIGEAKLDGGWVVAPLTIYTSDAITAVENGRVQLSVGYTCRLDTEVGEWQGQKYDAVQRDIVVNHVALVDTARAGSDARLRLDASDALACNTSIMQVLLGEAKKMAKLTIGGMVFEVADANAQAAYDGDRAAIVKVCDEKTAAANLRADNAEKLRDAAIKERDGLQGRLDAKASEGQVPVRFCGHEIAVADAVDPVKMDAFVTPIVEVRAAARASLLVEARRHLGANEKFDAHKSKDGKDIPAKSDTEIKRLVVLKMDPTAKLDGRSDDYVQARYDAAVEAAAKSSTRVIDEVRASVVGGRALQTEVVEIIDSDSARRAMIDRQMRANVRHPKHDTADKV